MEVTIDGHLEGSEWSHNNKKGNVKTVGIKRMSNEEYERELAEIRVHISVLEEWL